MFLYNLLHSIKRGEDAGNDPWDARTLEWMTPSPTPYENFLVVPTVTHRDEFWHRKYAEDEAGKAIPVPAGASEDHDVDADHEEGHIHMPDPSYWPLIQTLGFFPLGYGLVFYNWFLIGIGVVWLVIGMYGWIIEPLAEGDDDVPEDDTMPIRANAST